MVLPEKLEGARVLLRRLKPGDAPAICAHLRDGRIARWTQRVPHPYKKTDAVKFIRDCKTKWREGTGYNFATISKEDGALAGDLSLFGLDKENRTATIGYWLGARYQGKGLMREAVALLLDFGFKKLKLEKIRSRVDADNSRSQRVLESSGFKREGFLRKEVLKRGKRKDAITYGLLKSEYKRVR
ncbi:MAG: GNAT family N-acetyltransferase [Candidatus Micrarchaeia archaeon]